MTVALKGTGNAAEPLGLLSGVECRHPSDQLVRLGEETGILVCTNCMSAVMSTGIPVVMRRGMRCGSSAPWLKITVRDNANRPLKDSNV